MTTFRYYCPKCRRNFSFKHLNGPFLRPHLNKTSRGVPCPGVGQMPVSAREARTPSKEIVR